ncbi:MAG: beta-lactamase [Candidatus Taylorbacteria bacterium]|nr:beta-lactamase [Candidatus Taylorbacteria bacterium]
MKITKLGHCCLLIETKGKRILTDPGIFTVAAHSELERIDYVLFTHEHPDHFHLESLKPLLQKNPQAIVYANNSVDDLLTKESIPHIKISDSETVSLGDVQVVGIGEKHAAMHSSVPQSSNLGFFIDERLWYPGDAFTDPKRPVEILALPVSGPWMKIGEAIDYALELRPKKVFPVHDSIRFEFAAHVLPGRVLAPQGIEFIAMAEGDVKEF